MPELPEVETVVRSIAPHVRGRTILRAELRSHRVTRQSFEATERGLTGASILGVERRGKQIFVPLSQGTLYIHLGMTGKLLWNAPADRAAEKFTRAQLELDGGMLSFQDIRQFGRFEYFAALPAALSDKGPDALLVEFDTFWSRLQRHSGSVKSVLLNQSFVSGIGNIYADESLFAARIHPRTPANRLSLKRAQRLFEHSQSILAAAVALRGSSISDYVDPCGEKGSYQDMHQVYGRAGEPCPTCQRPIRRIVLAQRGTHFCPQCQRF